MTLFLTGFAFGVLAGAILGIWMKTRDRVMKVDVERLRLEEQRAERRK